MSDTVQRRIETDLGPFLVTVYGPNAGMAQAIDLPVVVNRVPYEVHGEFRVSGPWTRGEHSREREAVLCGYRPMRRLDRDRYDDLDPTDNARRRVNQALTPGILAFMDEVNGNGAGERAALRVKIQAERLGIEASERDIERERRKIAKHRERIAELERQVAATYQREEEAEDNQCRSCGAEYDDAGDGYDGECPDCADKSEREECVACETCGGEGEVAASDEFDRNDWPIGGYIACPACRPSTPST